MTSNILSRLTSNSQVTNTNTNGAVSPILRQNKPVPTAPIAPVPAESVPSEFPHPVLDASLAGLKSAFLVALKAHHAAKTTLSDSIATLIANGVSRDTAIAWGKETGLSDSYVRATVSGMYLSLTGQRVRAAGAGRKVNKGAEACALRVLKECKGDAAEAKSILRAAQRLIESWEKAGTLASNLAAAA